MFRGALLTALVEGGFAEPLTQKFATWAVSYQKHYQTEAERAIAFANFVKNDENYMAHNMKGKSWTMGHNQFSDLTWEQFALNHLGGFPEDPKKIAKYVDYSLLNVTDVAADLDWVARGAVTPVKNQAQCGSCWTFSTTGAIEGAYQIATGTLLSLSEQEIVSCSTTGGRGCQGGWPFRAIEWVEDHPLCLESAYPYTSGDGENGVCKTSCTGVVKTGGVVQVPDGSEKALKAALNIGPVSVLVEADRSAFNGYTSGILDNPACGTQLDHAVLLVAYGTDGGKDYWKIKNSWSASWGEGGYIRFIYGKNQCGISSGATYPTGVTAAPPTPPPAPTPPPTPPPAPWMCCLGACEEENCYFDWCHYSRKTCLKDCGGTICPLPYPQNATQNVVV